RMLETSEGPQVDWAETDALPVVARETTNLSALYGGPATLEQVLCRHQRALVLFTREQTPAGGAPAPDTPPQPPGPTPGAGAASIRPHRPGPTATYALHLQPQESDGIVEVTSTKTDDGRWKNGMTKGAPIGALFESADRSRLEELRRTLFGDAAAERAR